MKGLKEMLEECGAVRYGEFTLTSGKKSSYYVDIKKASTQPRILHAIADGMAEYVDCGRIAGMELGAVPIATAVSLATDIPFVMIRKKKRQHGTGSRIEGELQKGEKVIVVEDVTTTGGSSVETVNVLREEGAVVEKVISVVDRNEGARETLSKIEIELIALVSASELTG